MTVARAAVTLVAGRYAGAAMSRWERRADQYWHRSSAALGSLVIAQVVGWPVAQQLAVAVIGLLFGGGRWSPDADQGRVWGVVKWLVPDWLERLLGQPLRHHGVTHSVSIHAVLIGAGAVMAPAAWPIWWVAVAWLLHDLGDWLIGLPYQGEAGPAWVLWWGNRGLGRFKSGGFVGKVLTVCCWPAMAWLLWRAVS